MGTNTTCQRKKKTLLLTSTTRVTLSRLSTQPHLVWLTYGSSRLDFRTKRRWWSRTKRNLSIFSTETRVILSPTIHIIAWTNLINRLICLRISKLTISCTTSHRLWVRNQYKRCRETSLLTLNSDYSVSKFPRRIWITHRVKYLCLNKRTLMTSLTHKNLIS
jgi:hypothetical protein